MEKYGIEKIEARKTQAYYDAIVKNETDITPLATRGIGLHHLFQSRLAGCKGDASAFNPV